jgi:hypothetical protein
MAMIRFMQVRDIFCNGKRFGDYYEVVDLQSPLLSVLNIGAVVTRTKPPQPYREVPGGYIWLNRSVLPRFYFPQRATGAASLEDAITKLRADPLTATVEGPINGTSETGTVRIDGYRRNSIDLTVNTSAPAFLASSEPNYPGWDATIDGQATPIYNTNAAFRGISVPSGEHRIQFVFRPLLLYFSFSVSAVSWLAWIVFLKRFRSDNRA